MAVGKLRGNPPTGLEPKAEEGWKEIKKKRNLLDEVTE
jgi:hypothetical protein